MADTKRIHLFIDEKWNCTSHNEDLQIDGGDINHLGMGSINSGNELLKEMTSFKMFEVCQAAISVVDGNELKTHAENRNS